jgi:hypothetical protein
MTEIPTKLPEAVVQVAARAPEPPEREDYWFDGGVRMGRFNNTQPSDLRVYRTVGHDEITVQLRHEGWYMVRNLKRDDVVKLIHALVTELAEPVRAPR